MALAIESLFDREDFHKVCFLATDAELKALYERERHHIDDGSPEALVNLLCGAVAEMEMVRRGLMQWPMDN